jgi:hypothetical protein
MFCFIWAVGSTTNATGRDKFDEWIRERFSKHHVEFPEDAKVYDCHWNTESKEWENWIDTISAYEVDIRATFSDIVVPTMDSIRMKYLTKKLI